VWCKTIQSFHQPKGPTASSIVSTHTHTHTYTHALTHTHTHAHTHTPVSCRVEASQKRDSHYTNQGPTLSVSILSRTHPHAHIHTHARARTHTHARTRTHIHTRTHTHAHTYIPVLCRVEASQPRSRSDSSFARPVGYMSVAVRSCERVRKAVNTPKDGSLLNHSNESNVQR
jgi:hypothetical protein